MSVVYPLTRLGFSSAPLPSTVTFDLPEDAMRIYQNPLVNNDVVGGWSDHDQTMIELGSPTCLLVKVRPAVLQRLLVNGLELSLFIEAVKPDNLTDKLSACESCSNLQPDNRISNGTHYLLSEYKNVFYSGETPIPLTMTQIHDSVGHYKRLGEKMSAMDRHLPMDRDYTNEGGLVTLSTSDPVHHDMFVAYLSANPLSPLRIDIADRHLYREHLVLYDDGPTSLICEQKRLDIRQYPHETAVHRVFRIRRRTV